MYFLKKMSISKENVILKENVYFTGKCLFYWKMSILLENVYFISVPEPVLLLFFGKIPFQNPAYAYIALTLVISFLVISKSCG